MAVVSADRRAKLALHDGQHGAGRHSGCEWRCYGCGRSLATPFVGAMHRRADGMVSLAYRLPEPDQVVLASDLSPLSSPREGLKAFGPPDRQRLQGRGDRRGGEAYWSRTAHTLPIIVYCPQRECGRAQRIVLE